MGAEVLSGKSWQEIFDGVSAIDISIDGVGPALSLRLTKKEGVPIELVPEGTAGASVVAVRRVDELGFYSLGAKQLAENLGLTMPKAVAVVDHLQLRSDPDCYKEFKIGSSEFKRYSPKAIDAIRDALKREPVEEIWKKRQQARQTAA
jgi:hypothetical protein